MHNDTTPNTELSILDRAIKARARRDRDGKKRRPVTDSLIEYAEAQNTFLRMAREERDDLNASLVRKNEEIAALNARLDEIRENAVGLATIANEQAEA